MSKSIPQKIVFNQGKIYGVLRRPVKSKKIFIFLPASSGTRIGPQRIFVELALALYNIGLSSLCVDIPSIGDSYSTKEFDNTNTSNYFEWLTRKYEYYLQLIIDDITNKFDFDEISLISISYGCIPCYSYAIKNNIKHLIMLSPDHVIGSVEKINRKNIKSYYYKLFKKSTWGKIMRFQLNYDKIYKNIFNKKNLNQKQSPNLYSQNNELQILSLFGEKDEKKDVFIKYWENIIRLSKIKKYQYKIVENSDHSFFGWHLKRNVEEYMVTWLSGMEVENEKNAS